MEFSEQLKTARIAAGLTQTAMAGKTGIPRRTIQDWEAAIATPPEYLQRYVLAELAGFAEK